MAKVAGSQEFVKEEKWLNYYEPFQIQTVVCEYLIVMYSCVKFIHFDPSVVNQIYVNK